jgi:hypothetical protein
MAMSKAASSVSCHRELRSLRKEAPDTGVEFFALDRGKGVQLCLAVAG